MGYEAGIPQKGCRTTSSAGFGKAIRRTDVKDNVASHLTALPIDRRYEGRSDALRVSSARSYNRLSHMVPVTSTTITEGHVRSLPFTSRGDASHTVQPIYHPFTRQQDLLIEVESERALQSRLVSGLRQKIAQRAKLTLEMEFPSCQHHSALRSGLHGHELSNVRTEIRLSCRASSWK